MNRLTLSFAAALFLSTAALPAFAQDAKVAKDAADTSKAAKKVDLNTASDNDILAIPGLGVTLAKEVIKNRPYKSVDDVKKVPGIDAARFEIMKPHITVGETK